MKTQSQKEPLMNTLARQLGSAAGIIAKATHELTATAVQGKKTSRDPGKLSIRRTVAKKNAKGRGTKVSPRRAGRASHKKSNSHAGAGN
jgi:hypothetical protein